MYIKPGNVLIGQKKNSVTRRLQDPNLGFPWEQWFGIH